MRKILWSLLEMVETIAIAIVVVFLVRYFIAQPFLVSGASMEPNFYDGNYLLIDELTYRFREPKRGEVVVFRFPQSKPFDKAQGKRAYYIKRIVGLPGEQIVVQEGTVTVYKNGEPRVLDEPYAWNTRVQGRFDVRLDQDEYFVMGDNRGFSFDSRSWGALLRDDIVGVARLRLWPVNQVMAFSAPTY